MRFSPYSFSRMSSYETCPKKFQFSYIDKIPVNRSTTALDKGSYIHHCLELHPAKPSQFYNIDKELLINYKTIRDFMTYNEIFDEETIVNYDDLIKTHNKNATDEYSKYHINNKKKQINFLSNLTQQIPHYRYLNWTIPIFNLNCHSGIGGITPSFNQHQSLAYKLSTFINSLSIDNNRTNYNKIIKETNKSVKDDKNYKNMETNNTKITTIFKTYGSYVENGLNKLKVFIINYLSRNWEHYEKLKQYLDYPTSSSSGPKDEFSLKPIGTTITETSTKLVVVGKVLANAYSLFTGTHKILFDNTITEQKLKIGMILSSTDALLNDINK